MTNVPTAPLPKIDVHCPWAWNKKHSEASYYRMIYILTTLDEDQSPFSVNSNRTDNSQLISTACLEGFQTIFDSTSYQLHSCESKDETHWCSYQC